MVMPQVLQTAAIRMWLRLVETIGRQRRSGIRILRRQIASIKRSSGEELEVAKAEAKTKAKLALKKVLRQRNWEANQLFGPVVRPGGVKLGVAARDKTTSDTVAPDSVPVRVRQSGFRDLDGGITFDSSRVVHVNSSDIERLLENGQLGRATEVARPSVEYSGVKKVSIRATSVPIERLRSKADPVNKLPLHSSSALSDSLPLEYLCRFPLTSDGDHQQVRAGVERGLELFWSKAASSSSSSSSSLSSPSVSAVLQKTMPPESLVALERWKAQMVAQLGMDGFLRYQQETFAVGTQLHQSIARHISGQTLSTVDVDERIANHWKSLQHIFPDISEVSLLEQRIGHPVLRYRGIFDCLAKYRGTTVLIEWKTSQKPKSQLQFTYDNPLQVAAYIGALNFSGQLDYQVTRAAIVIAYSSGAPAHLHYMNEELCREYWIAWLRRFHHFLTLGS